MIYLSKVELAKLLHKEANASKGELVQFFHSNYYKDELKAEQYIPLFISFRTQLDKDLESFKNFTINDTFLKDKPFTPSKIPKKILKQLELEYIEHQKYLEQDIKEAREQN